MVELHWGPVNPLKQMHSHCVPFVNVAALEYSHTNPDEAQGSDATLELLTDALAVGETETETETLTPGELLTVGDGETEAEPLANVLGEGLLLHDGVIDDVTEMLSLSELLADAEPIILGVAVADCVADQLPLVETDGVTERLALALIVTEDEPLALMLGDGVPEILPLKVALLLSLREGDGVAD